MIAGIHHVQITVDPADVEAARRFYCEVLQLVELEKPDSLRERGGFWVTVGDRQLHIGLEVDVDRTSTKAHIAYQVDDLVWWRARLLSEGVAIIESVPISGYERFETRDPFGNRMEFIHAK